jgi:hypothetical protein
MAHTAALPLGTSYAPIVPPLQTATRVIPANGNQPQFGLMPTMVVNGSTQVANAFYDANMQYINNLQYILPSMNMQANLYLGMIPGIVKSPIPAGS